MGGASFGPIILFNSLSRLNPAGRKKYLDSVLPAPILSSIVSIVSIEIISSSVLSVRSTELRQRSVGLYSGNPSGGSRNPVNFLPGNRYFGIFLCVLGGIDIHARSACEKVDNGRRERQRG